MANIELRFIGTMTSGKSTLINAMLGYSFFPMSNEGTVGVKSISVEIDANTQGLKYLQESLVLTEMAAPNISQIRDYNYCNLFDGDNKKIILYVLNAYHPGTCDEISLLEHIAEAMAEGGRQSQDRFIFALNKADEFDPEKGEDIKTVMERVRKYLEDHKIYNPKIFPCDARSAKVFRQYLNHQPMTEIEEDDVLPRHTKIVKREWRHFSDLAPLSLANRKALNAMLDEAEKDGGETGSIKQALVYTGIPAIELAVNEYISEIENNK